MATKITEEVRKAYNDPKHGTLTAFNDVQGYYMDGIDVLDDETKSDAKKLLELRDILSQIGEVAAEILPG